MGAIVCGTKDSKLVINPMTPRMFKEETEKSWYSNESFDIDDPLILELSIKCTNLSTDNRFQLLNPVAHVFVEENGSFIKKFETEVDTSTLNPVFKKALRIGFSLTKNINFEVKIYDVPAKRSENMFIGGNFFSLHEICSKSDYMVKDLMNKNRRTGQIMISAKEMKFLNSVITLQ